MTERGFARIERIQDILPGDLVAINYKPEANNLDCTTGHLMIARSPATAIALSPPLMPDTIQWELEVIDCTNKGHGTSDSRYLGPGIYRKGIGKGFIRLYTLENGKIAGYTWRTHESSKLYLEDSRPLAIGRVDESEEICD